MCLHAYTASALSHYRLSSLNVTTFVLTGIQLDLHLRTLELACCVGSGCRRPVPSVQRVALLFASLPNGDGGWKLGWLSLWLADSLLNGDLCVRRLPAIVPRPFTSSVVPQRVLRVRESESTPAPRVL